MTSLPQEYNLDSFHPDNEDNFKAMNTPWRAKITNVFKRGSKKDLRVPRDAYKDKAFHLEENEPLHADSTLLEGEEGWCIPTKQTNNEPTKRRRFSSLPKVFGRKKSTSVPDAYYFDSQDSLQNDRLVDSGSNHSGGYSQNFLLE